MATYNPSSVGVTAPSGGFQQGGWYGGRQYWGGTLSDAGVIHPQSNQQGAGQAVSDEVNAQSAQQQGVSTQQFNQYLADQNAKSAGGTSGSSTGGGGYNVSGTAGGSAGGSAIPTTPQQSEFDLIGLQESLFKEAGIEGLDAQLFEKNKAFTDAQAQINDNPFLSEATRVGRIQKLTMDFNNNVKNLQDEIATKRADVEMKLNLQIKQFDINSQIARDSLDRLNLLLQNGFLNNASGDDIAQLTRQTGISSQAIYSAINAQKDKDRQTQVITATADSGEVTAVVIDTQTGQVISNTSLGNIGNKQTGSSSGDSSKFGSPAYKAEARNAIDTFVSSKLNSYGDIHPNDWAMALDAFVKDDLGDRTDFSDTYGQFADTNRGDFVKAYGFNKPELVTGLGT